ncbi:UPF0187-domain-containing protein [Pluteus cervinus]|uniref:UPF0187-domain-containing protein n=1 Tax=Pluteus cervinus TaxID=181527 RepID=A0ACD3AMW4_9AGAR|nr:UPF0187-domain-containing protein [Pluteus cervinus]
MPTRDPLFRGRWTIMKRFRTTIINDIYPEMIFFSLVATMVTLVSKFTTTKLIFDNGLLTVLGTVLSLTISFRTSSSYERYQEGRKMWSAIATSSKNLAGLIWIHIPNEREGGPSPLECMIEKKTMINLIQAFSVACKHFLRGESGVYYQDLFPLICVLPRYASESHAPDNMLPLWQASEDTSSPGEPSRSATIPVGNGYKQSPSFSGTLVDEDLKGSTKRQVEANGRSAHKQKTFDPEQVLPSFEVHRPLKPARDPPKATFGDYIPFWIFLKWVGRTIARKAMPQDEAERRAKLKRKMKHLCESNVPLEIILFLSSYSAYLNTTVPSVASGILSNLATLQDTYQQLERIAYTPLPFAYQAHLRISLWIYLFFLPFQIYAKFGWLTIPGTAFATFSLVGFLEIGHQIENPFTYDLNDLDLDGFCLSLQRELHEITAHTNPDPKSYIFSAWNQPFAPTDRRSAADLVAGGDHEYVSPKFKGIHPGMSSVNLTLINNWREVDLVTRDPKKQ